MIAIRKNRNAADVKQAVTRERTGRSPEICVIFGTRPGIVMLAPVIHELRHCCEPFFILHSGQHYSPAMDADLFRDFQRPAPDVRLPDIQTKTTHGAQTAAMLVGMESVLMARRPAAVVVGGDANTNLAGALAARKLGICVAHVEAGERSDDWSMPEEHNRRMIDHISDLLFATNERARTRLLQERVRGRIEITGNPIVDASLYAAGVANEPAFSQKQMETMPNQYILLTAHRQENVDHRERLAGLLQGAADLSIDSDLPVLFPVHPRTRKRLVEFGMEDWLAGLRGIKQIEPVPYLSFTRLLAKAALVLTDSGGVQQEAYIHHRLCVTLRENTEWVDTLHGGANRLAGTDRHRIVEAGGAALRADPKEWLTPFGDGMAASRIVRALINAIGN